MPLDVVGTVPALVLGDEDQLKGEIWLSNSTNAAINISAATLTVTFGTGAETGSLQISSGTSVGANTSKRLLISFGMQPFTPPGTYTASVDLTFDNPAGTQSIPATVMIGERVRIGLATAHAVFNTVAASTTTNSSVVVVNRGNLAFAVHAIADEPLFEVLSTPRLLATGSGGVVVVQPAVGLTPLAQKLTFTNSTPTIPAGGWADVAFSLTTPATLPARAHLRALPRIGTERFTIDLLTA